MKFSTTTGKLNTLSTDCIVVGIFEGKQLSDAAKALDQASSGAIKAHLRHGDLHTERSHTLMLYEAPKVKAKRILLVELGKRKDYDGKAFKAAARHVLQRLKTAELKKVCIALPLPTKQLGWAVQQLAIQAGHVFYHNNVLRHTSKKSAHTLKQIDIHTDNNKQTTEINQVLKVAAAVIAGQDYCKELGNLPPNVCTPSYLAKQARAMARQYSKIKVKILTEAQMKKLGMGALLAVSQGSAEPGHLICIEYNGAAKAEKPVVLVGKGVTFDTGGVNLKPGNSMMGMKYDMGGAAAVFGTMKTVASYGLKQNVIGIVGAVENMPSSTAYKPQDIITSMSKQTIEITNTDAEGRMVLCDALTYARRYKPATVIDIATLTGACLVSLGHDLSALFTDDEKLASALLGAADEIDDPTWRLPLWAPYQRLLQSDHADMVNANVKGGGAGSITAALFLSRFTKDLSWAHLDIAGSAFGGEHNGATGRPVPLLMQYLLNRKKR